MLAHSERSTSPRPSSTSGLALLRVRCHSLTEVSVVLKSDACCALTPEVWNSGVDKGSAASVEAIKRCCLPELFHCGLSGKIDL